jgi:uncharacterized protein (DUF2267 family)
MQDDRSCQTDRRRAAIEDAKAAEDRHIGFRWLRWAARLESEGAAEAVFRSVAHEFARRVGRNEALHLAAHLPLGLREIWLGEAAGAGAPARLGRAELVNAVQSRLGLAQAEQAEELLLVVLGWLKHLAPEETADVAALLPRDLRALWERAHPQHVPPWQRLRLGAR